MRQTRENKERAHHAALALKAMPCYDPHGGADNVTDLLADLRHYCDAKGYNFDDLDRRAYNHHIEEKGKE